jgi:hypothetical protein
MLGSWHVPLYVAVCQGALKPSHDALSGERHVAGLDCSLWDAWPPPE